MDKDYLIKLTLALYRVTDCFPEKEPLRYAIREVAAKIFAAGVSGSASSAFENEISLLKSYFALAKAQHWVASENFDVLEKGYDSLGALERQPVVQEKKSMTPAGPTVKNKKKNNLVYSPLERKQKLISIIQQEEKITLKDLLNKFPEIHRRTLIRDLERLQKENIIKKQGNGRGTFYFPNGMVTTFEQMVTEGDISAQE